MGLPPPLGPLHVSMADFELKRSDGQENVVGHSPDLPEPPLFRVYYPTIKPARFDFDHRGWLPDVMYMYGYSSVAIPPTNPWNKFKLCMAAGLGFCFMALQAFIPASVAKPLPPNEADGGMGPSGDGKLPVVIFTHGLWSMRTTYSAICCDLASYGYVVVVPEHLDGSACMARSTLPNGRTKWLHHSPIMQIDEVPADVRIRQQTQRVSEIKSILYLLDQINEGSVVDSANAVRGKEGLLASMFKGRLQLDNVAACGHSFGGVTAAYLAQSEPRITACVSLDSWWTPLVDAGVEITAGLRPLLAINASDFGGRKLRAAQKKVLESRDSANEGNQALVTDVLVLKGARHQDFSDLPLILPGIARKTGATGVLGGAAVRLITTRSIVDFLHTHFLHGSSFPYDAAKLTESDKEHVLIESV